MNNLNYLEIFTRLTNLIRVVTITEVNHSVAQAKVKFNNIETPFLNWLAFKSAKNYIYSAPEVGEQALLLSPCGDINQGIILTGIYQNKFKIEDKKASNNFIVFEDKTKIKYDSSAKKLLIDVKGEIEIMAGGAKLQIKNNKIKITGGDLEVGGKTFLTHTHTSLGQGNKTTPPL